MNARGFDELDRLLMAMADGELSLQDRARLLRLLESDSSARERYSEFVLLDCLLGWERYSVNSEASECPAVAGRIGPGVAEPPVEPRSQWRIWSRWLGFVAGLVVLLGVGLLATHERWSRVRPVVVGRESAERFPDGPVSGGIAILTHAIGVEWEPGGPSPSVDSILEPGTLEFRSGLIRLEFFSGATVIVEGPAAIDLKAIDRASCRRGKLRALVPPEARGFRIDSPAADLVDLGTEFVLSVGPNRDAEVYVVDGKVEVYGPGTDRATEAPRELTEGQSLRIGSIGEVVGKTVVPGTFPSFQEMDRRAADESRHRLDSWRDDSRRWAADPRVVVYYPFEFRGQPSGLAVLSQTGPRPGAVGSIVGCGRVRGRWPGKGALDFKRPSDRVRITVPGTYDSMTFLAWVRVDALPQRLTALMLTDGFDFGEIHWQIGPNGELALGVHSETEEPVWRTYQSPPVFVPERLGRWTLLATVYDAGRRLILHYADGREVSRHPTVERVRPRIGQAELGNWGAPRSGDRTPIRNLIGRIDEFLILDVPLGQSEIAATYQRGRPGP